jgi:hypothetical protein
VITESLHRRDGAIKMNVQIIESGLTKAKAKARQPDPDVISFEAAVAEGKRIVAVGDSNAWRLARIADQVEPKYGDKTLRKLAEEIGGIAECTLERRRSVVRFWKGIPASPPESFAVAQELAALAPERAVQIIEDKPNITSREARTKVREWKQQQQQPQQQQQQDSDGRLQESNGQLEEDRRWFRKVVDHAHDAYRDGQLVKDPLDPERRKILRQAIEPNLLPDLRAGGKALIDLADFLQRLLEEASTTTPDEASGDQTTTPAEASAIHQAT